MKKDEEDEYIQMKQEGEKGASKPNNAGVPDNLKTGIENLYGMSMDDVKVHYSEKKEVNSYIKYEKIIL
jgi:hypothetical protein